MALSIYDFVKGIDFTALATAAAGDHNNLIDQATPKADTGVEGKGIVIWTIDSALNTPIVPDASVTTKWVRYIWLRIPHITAASTVPMFYAWNDNATSVATYLKWQRIEADLTVVNASIAALQAEVDAVEITAATAQSLANTANNIASAAQNTANAAAATAATAAANALQALTDAATGLAAANAAQSTANTALANANAAQTTANNAAAAAATVSTGTFFTSSEFALAAGVVMDTAHGLSTVPKFVRFVLKCIDASGDNGFAQNDEIDITSVYRDTGYPAFSAGANATNVSLGLYSTAIACTEKTGGSASLMDSTKWKAKCYAWK